jgi:hypothetical protein
LILKRTVMRGKDRLKGNGVPAGRAAGMVAAYERHAGAALAARPYCTQYRQTSAIDATIDLHQVQQFTISQERHHCFLGQLLQVVAANPPRQSEAPGVLIDGQPAEG